MHRLSFHCSLYVCLFSGYIDAYMSVFNPLLTTSNICAVYKDELEDTEMGMEIGLPTDVKHVTHIGLDGCASSILSKGWNNLTNPDTTNLPSFSSTPLQLAMANNAENPTIRSLLETK